jgi:phenylalanyl-tRNA synthetase beta subunit
VIAPLRAHAGALRNEAAGFAGPLLESIQFVREYAGPPLAEWAKSVSFRVTVGSPERTLSSEEVGAIRAGMIAGMRGLGYELRV